MHGEVAGTDEADIVRHRHFGNVDFLEPQHSPENLCRLADDAFSSIPSGRIVSSRSACVRS